MISHATPASLIETQAEATIWVISVLPYRDSVKALLMSEPDFYIVRFSFTDYLLTHRSFAELALFWIDEKLAAAFGYETVIDLALTATGMRDLMHILRADLPQNCTRMGVIVKVEWLGLSIRKMIEEFISPKEILLEGLAHL